MEQTEANRWHVTNRWLEYEGELRAGLLRVLLITSFYAIELVNFFTIEKANEGLEQFHRQATYLSAAWLLVSLAALVAIGRRYLPAGLKYATSGLDVGLLTAVVWFGSGAASPLACMYLLLVVMAGLRGSLKLIWFTTALSLAAYLSLLLAPQHVALDGNGAAIATAQTVKPITAMVFALAIAASGLLTGQLVRMLRQVISETCLRSQAATVSVVAGGEVQP